MKIFKFVFFTCVMAVLLSAGAIVYIYSQRVPLLEKAANQATLELFEGTLRLKHVDIKNWRIVIEGAEGTMKMDTRKVPVKIERLTTETSLLESFQTRRSEVSFENFQPTTSQGAPLSGKLFLDFNENPSSKIEANLSHVWIEDYAWIDPVSFNGLRGYVSGKLTFSLDSRENANFDIDLKSEPTGGEVPARFLEFALPYLPKAQNTKQLRKQIEQQKSVKFVNGIVTAKTAEAGKIQAQVKMLFPELNINLNLNLTILVDEEHAFLRAFKLLTLFKINQA